jgi:hypothetical protein
MFGIASKTLLIAGKIAIGLILKELEGPVLYVFQLV